MYRGPPPPRCKEGNARPKLSVIKLFKSMSETRTSTSAKQTLFVSQYHLNSVSRCASEEFHDRVQTFRSSDSAQSPYTPDMGSRRSPPIDRAFARNELIADNVEGVTDTEEGSEEDSKDSPKPLLGKLGESHSHLPPLLGLTNPDNLGCNRPIELIQSRASERSRRQTLASFTREQGDCHHLEAITKSIQDKFTREAREIHQRECEDRRTKWLKIIAMSIFQSKLAHRIPQQLQEERDTKARLKAAEDIQSVYRTHRQYRIHKIFSKLTTAHPRFTHSFALPVSSYMFPFGSSISILYLFSIFSIPRLVSRMFRSRGWVRTYDIRRTVRLLFEI